MGGKSQSITIGYKYYLGVQIALTQGEIDSWEELIIGERSAWNDGLEGEGDITVDRPDLFGGEKREGGVAGKITLTNGVNPIQDSYLLSKIGVNVPAYIGLTTVIFKNFYWSAMNPYFKAPWFTIRRILKGWSNGFVWYPEKATINSLDMNPAHIIYQCITDNNWGMGYSQTDVDLESFAEAADQLFAEEFGLSLVWNQQTTINDFIQFIMDHINGSLRLDLSSGKFVFKLIRDDYVINDLTVLNPSNSIMSSFQRTGWGELANELTVKYYDRQQNEASVTVQDLAAIDIQGAIVTSTKNYPGIRTQELAMRVAMRDLATSSATLAKITMVTSRVLFKHEVGDVVALTWPNLGIVTAPFRIASIDKGTLADGKITIEAIEDMFGLPTGAYTAVQESNWEDSSVPAIPVTSPIVVEAPYWDIIRGVSRAEFSYLTPGYAFAEATAQMPDILNYGFNMYESPDPDTVDYKLISSGHFSPVATLAEDIWYTTDELTISNLQTAANIRVGSYAIILGSLMEYVSIEGIDPVTGNILIGRGVLDTVPRPHVAGTKIYFADGNLSHDPTEYAIGITEHYKLAMRTPVNIADISTEQDLEIEFIGRAHMPYPPANIKINDTYYPEYITGETLTVQWATRNRLAQTVELVPYNEPSIGIEPGAHVLLKILNENLYSFIELTPSSPTFSLDRSEEITSNIFSYPANVLMRGIGLEKLTTTLSSALSPYFEKTIDPMTLQLRTFIGPKNYVKVLGGYMGHQGNFVDESTGAVTHLEYAYAAKTPFIVPRPAVPKLPRLVPVYDPDIYPFPRKLNPYIGMAFYPNLIGVGVNPTAEAFQYSHLRDRRVNPEHIVSTTSVKVPTNFTPQSVNDVRAFIFYEYYLVVEQKTNITVGPNTPIETPIETFFVGDDTTFNAIIFPTVNPVPAGEIEETDTQGIIFGELVYTYCYTGGTLDNTAGKTIDITAFVESGHFAFAKSLIPVTKRYKIASDGTLTYLDTRSAILLADHISTTEGVEVDVFSQSVTLVDSATGDLGATLGTISYKPLCILGNKTDHVIYIMSIAGIIYKYSDTLTLLGSIDIATPLTQQGLLTSYVLAQIPPYRYSELKESAGFIYARYYDKWIQVEKNLAFTKPISFTPISPGYTDPSSSIMMAYSIPDAFYDNFTAIYGPGYGLADENGVSSADFNLPKSRINSELTVELDCVREDIHSYQKNSVVVKRSGYGMRYGKYS